MPRLTIDYAGEWLTYAQGIEASGIPEKAFDRFVKLGLIECYGRGKGQRFLYWDVLAVSKLWRRLDLMLKDVKTEENEPEE